MRISLPVAAVEARRLAVRCLSDGHKVSTDDEAARYVDERGFVPIMRLAGSQLPSLSEADIRPAWEGFDITDGAWRWKEVLPQQKRCAYGKFLRQRGFFLSWRLFPAFYLLYRRPRLPDQAPNGTLGGRDHDQDYAAGLLSRQEWLILETIAARGPIDSRRLWRALKRAFDSNRSRFEQALVALQAGFRIMVAGGDLEGWSMHYWDLVERQVPGGLLNRLPSPEEAREALLYQYVANTVVCTAREAAGFFHWDLSQTQGLIAQLVAAGRLAEVEVEGWKGAWLWAV